MQIEHPGFEAAEEHGRRYDPDVISERVRALEGGLTRPRTIACGVTPPAAREEVAWSARLVGHDTAAIVRVTC